MSIYQTIKTTLLFAMFFSNTKFLVKSKKSIKIRLLTAIEAERIQGFPSDWTKDCLIGEVVKMPLNKRRFMMGNALVVKVTEQMEPFSAKIIDCEGEVIQF